MSKVIDISKHQGEIDFLKVKNAGVTGVMCRCSFGGKPDIKFEANIENAQAADLPVGAYVFCTWHYLSVSVNKATAMLAARSEAEKVIAILQNHKISGPVSIDLELEKDKTTLLTKDEMTETANAYMDKLSNAGYSPVIYASASWFYDMMDITKINYPLWVAYYNDSGLKSEEFPQNDWGSKMNAVKDKIWMWQYSSKVDGKSYGVSSKYVDLNHCYKEFKVKDLYSTAASNVPYENIQSETQPAVSETVLQKYTVVSDDTMSGIASKFGITLNALADANPQVTNINRIYVGQVLNIPTSKMALHSLIPIKVGDRVRVKSGSKTYTGGNIASFVYKGIYTVDELKGDRAVLDKKGICTPVNISSLDKVN